MAVLLGMLSPYLQRIQDEEALRTRYQGRITEVRERLEQAKLSRKADSYESLISNSIDPVAEQDRVAREEL